MRLLYFKGSTSNVVLDEMKVVYGEDAPSYDAVKHWHGQFKCGRASVETVPSVVSLSKTHYPLHSTGLTQEDSSQP